MSTANVLAILKGVHLVGRDQWRGDCPNPIHEHVRGSLAISQAPTGATLMHCFACGDTSAILRALGLTAGDLFPERLRDPTPEQLREARAAFRRFAWAAALGVLRREGDVVFMFALQLARDQVMPAGDIERLRDALGRIEGALGVLRHE